MKTEYRMLLEVTPETRRRLDMVRMIINLERPGENAGTWDNVIEWLVNMVPINEILAELCKPATTNAPNGG